MSTFDPYQPPMVEVTHKVEPAENQLAGRGQRLGAALLDGGIGLLFGVPVMFALGTWDYVKQGKPLPLSLMIVSVAVGFLFFFLVHGYFLKSNGQTIGKMIIGIRIADLENNVPSFAKVIGLRYLPLSLCTLVPAVGQFLPLIDALFIFRSDRRCVHDLIAGTRVIR